MTPGRPRRYLNADEAAIELTWWLMDQKMVDQDPLNFVAECSVVPRSTGSLGNQPPCLYSEAVSFRITPGQSLELRMKFIRIDFALHVFGEESQDGVVKHPVLIGSCDPVHEKTLATHCPASE